MTLHFSDFSFDFSEDLLARNHRDVEDVQLLVIDCETSKIDYARFLDVVLFLPFSSCTVWNDTLAGPSQLDGAFDSGMPIIMCFLQPSGESISRWEAIVLASREPQTSGRFTLSTGEISGSVVRKTHDFDAGYWNEKGLYAGYRALVDIDQPREQLRRILDSRGRLIHPWYTDLNELL